jgi:hypothetical protein
MVELSQSEARKRDLYLIGVPISSVDRNRGEIDIERGECLCQQTPSHKIDATISGIAETGRA